MNTGAEGLFNKSRSFGLTMKNIWNQLGMIIVLVVMCIILSFIAPNFLETVNMLNVLKQVSIIAILASGMTLVILTGGIDLSVGATLALSGVISVMLSERGFNPFVAMFAGIAIGYLAGMINGYFTAKTKLPSFIVTLGSMTYVRGIAYVISGGSPIVLTSETFKFFGSGKILAIPTPIYIMLIIYVITFLVLKYTMFGRHIYAIGGNEEAARLTGIKVERTLIHVYAIILGGTSFAGGIGRIQMTIIGVLIMGVIGNGLTLLDVSYYWQLVAKGAVIIIAVLLDRLRSNM
jgi:ribose transport system permease protein